MRLYDKLELLTRKRIFYLLLILVPAILPPLTAKGLRYLLKVADFSVYVANALFDYKSAYARWMPLLPGIILLAILMLVIFRQRAGRAFAVFAAANFSLTVLTQTMVVTEAYGLVILTEIFLWYMTVIALWVWEAFLQKTDFSFRGGARPWWLILLAVIAFWNPDEAWNLSLSFFVYGFSPVAFCMLTPIYLTVLMFAYPRLNLPLLRVQSFTGLIVGFISLFISLIQAPSAGIYWTLLHTPLIAVSWYAFRKGLQARPDPEPEATRGSASRPPGGGARPGLRTKTRTFPSSHRCILSCSF